jgi:hypothetical protein
MGRRNGCRLLGGSEEFCGIFRPPLSFSIQSSNFFMTARTARVISASSSDAFMFRSISPKKTSPGCGRLRFEQAVCGFAYHYRVSKNNFCVLKPSS